MKTQTRTRVVKMSDEDNVREYTAELSADFFDLIINNIYTDKISSVIREIGCNAYDAHIVNGNEDTPIEVHLPSQLEPYFYIKDQGTGLSEKSMDELYTRLGASDKRDSNNTTGCKGIGSKSPFCYSDSFTVESCYDGERKLYSCFIGEDSKPKIKTTFTTDTSQPNGLIVQLPVKYNDFSTFEQKCMIVMQHFKVAPNIVGSTAKFPDRKIKLEGSCWRLYEQKNYDSYTASAIMGNVSYPLESTSKITDENFDYEPLLKSYIEIDFDLGELTPAGGRERLSYDDHTVSKICQKLDIVSKDILKHIEDEVAKCDTLWKARCKFLDMVGGFYHRTTLRKMDINYNGNPLFTDGTALKINEYRADKKDSNATDFVYCLNSNSSKKYNYNEDLITPSNHIIFVINDIDAGGVSRAIQYCGDNIDYNVPTHDRLNVYFISIEDQKQVDAMIKFLGDPETLLASDLPKVRTNRIAIEREPATKIQTFDSTKYNSSSKWVNSEKTTADSGIFLEISRHKCKDNSGDFVNPENLSSVIKKLEILDYTIPVIYGIKTAAMKQKRMQKGIQGDNPRWVCFWKYAIEKLDQQLTKFNVPLTLANSRAQLTHIDLNCLDNVLKYTTCKDIISLYTHIKVVKTGIVQLSKSHTLDDLAKECSVPLATVDPLYDLNKELKEIKTKYPLLKYCDFINDGDLSDLGIYLNQIEKEKAND